MKLKRIGYMLLALGCSLSGQDYRDIYVADKVMIQRTTLEGQSSRMIAVGHPGGFNFAFNAVDCAPSFVWFGGFLDFSGETNGRGGKGSKVLGIEQTLGIEAVPFRVDDPGRLPDSLVFGGYRRDSETGEPMFLFEVDGVVVEQRLVSSAENSVVLEFHFPNSLTQNAFYHLDPDALESAQLSDGLSWRSNTVIKFPIGSNAARIHIQLTPTDKEFVRIVPELSGAETYQNLCSACHSTDGTKLIGPTFKGLWGRTQNVSRDGRMETVTTNEAYLRESVGNPQAAIVKGFEAVPMANFSSVITADQMDRLIEYLKGIH